MQTQVDPSPAQDKPRQFSSFSEASSFIWGIADLLRGDFKQQLEIPVGEDAA